VSRGKRRKRRRRMRAVAGFIPLILLNFSNLK